MYDRVIKSKARGSSVQLLHCLSSLFVTELLNPSPELYLISPWISKVSLINNRFGQFRAVTSGLNKSELHLGDILTLLAEKGTHIFIMCRPNHPLTEEFVKPLLTAHSGIQCRRREALHEKGLITHNFYLRGSMNFTYSGVNLNDESVELTLSSQAIARALIEAKADWEG
jgi:hypothetical protein